jgi:hypothetical protein
LQIGRNNSKRWAALTLKKETEMKNRVEQQWLEILKTFADNYWDTEIEQAHDLFGTPYPNNDDKDYIKKTTFLDNAKRSKLQMLKYLAQSKPYWRKQYGRKVRSSTADSNGTKKN